MQTIRSESDLLEDRFLVRPVDTPSKPTIDRKVLTVADAVAEELHAAGVDRVFGLPGGEVLLLMEALRQREIEFVLCRHEADAGLAAAVYGKLKRVPGVVLTTLGPGSANLLLAISSSLLDREPLLAISAQLAHDIPAALTHQRLPLLDVYRPVTKFSAALDRFTCRQRIRESVSACMTEPMGPAFLTLSADEAGVSAEDMHDGVPELHMASPELRLDDAADAAAKVRERIAVAKQPLVLVGLGAAAETAPGLRQWVNDWNLPVGVTPKVKGIVDETADNFIGVFGGMAIDSLMVEAVAAADLVIGFGLDPVEIDKEWHLTAPILWMLESPGATGALPHGELIPVAHVQVLEELLATPPPEMRETTAGVPFAEIRRRRLRFATPRHDGKAQRLLKPIELVAALARCVPPETIVTTDVGSHKYLFGQFWPSTRPETFFMSNGLSGMGYGLPAAIGAKLARPEATVVCVLGDGGFSMNSQELETTIRVGAHLLVIVLVDHSYSLIKLAQESRGLPNFGVDFNPIDNVATARACGALGTRVETVAELEEAVADALAASNTSTTVIEALIDYSSYRELI